MQHYRLLRNNKESGPYTWKELADLPLKPYDLVWLDGKSAAWRYASELPEFKALAPAVEEDFYQVFHTRQAEPQTEPAKLAASVPLSAPPPVVDTTELPLQENNHKKHVTVILPESASSPKREPVLRVISPLPKSTPVLDKQLEPVAETTAVIPSVVTAKRIPYGVSLAAVFLTVSLAVFFGIKFLSDNPVSASVSAGSEQNTRLPVIQTLAAEPSEEDLPTLPSNPALEFAALKRYLTIKPDQINVGIFGGISRLQLLVQNNHSQPIESIRIAVDFLEKDQSLHHTELVEIPVINANSSLKVKVPANGSGRAIQTRVLGIGQYSN